MQEFKQKNQNRLKKYLTLKEEMKTWNIYYYLLNKTEIMLKFSNLQNYNEELIYSVFYLFNSIKEKKLIHKNPVYLSYVKMVN